MVLISDFGILTVCSWVLTVGSCVHHSFEFRPRGSSFDRAVGLASDWSIRSPPTQIITVNEAKRRQSLGSFEDEEPLDLLPVLTDDSLLLQAAQIEKVCSDP